jgi:hypothetical protein
VRRELADEDFDAEEIRAHPRLRRRLRTVNLWTRLLPECDNGKDAHGVWVSVTKQFPMA